MADLSVNTGQAGRVQPGNDVALALRAGAPVTPLQAVHTDTDGDVILSDASLAGTAIFDGVVMNGAADGGTVTVVREGAVFGFDLSSQTYGDVIYLSDTAGALADAAGTVSVAVGKVIKLNGEKVVYLGYTS